MMAVKSASVVGQKSPLGVELDWDLLTVKVMA